MPDPRFVPIVTEAKRRLKLLAERLRRQEEARQAGVLAQPMPTAEPGPRVPGEPVYESREEYEKRPAARPGGPGSEAATAPPSPSLAERARAALKVARIAALPITRSEEEQRQVTEIAKAAGKGLAQPFTAPIKAYQPFSPAIREEGRRELAESAAATREDPLAALFFAAPPGAMGAVGVVARLRAMRDSLRAAQVAGQRAAAATAVKVGRPGAALKVMGKPQVAGAAERPLKTYEVVVTQGTIKPKGGIEGPLERTLTVRAKTPAAAEKAVRNSGIRIDKVMVREKPAAGQAEMPVAKAAVQRREAPPGTLFIPEGFEIEAILPFAKAVRLVNRVTGEHQTARNLSPNVLRQAREILAKPPAAAAKPAAATKAPMAAAAKPQGTAKLFPGDWAVDDSAHKYTVSGKPKTGYQWEAVNSQGKYSKGVASKRADAEQRARFWAGVVKPSVVPAAAKPPVAAGPAQAPRTSRAGVLPPSPAPPAAAPPVRQPGILTQAEWEQMMGPRPVAAAPPGKPPVQPPTVTGAPEPLPTGETGKSLQDADAAIARFSEWLKAPERENAWDLTVQMRRETLAQRAGRLEARAQELVVQGKPVEEAIQQAVQETMSGRLPSVTTDLTTAFRDALFAKVYRALEKEPFEMMSTAEALRNALAGLPVPRIPGTAGGSAYSRLQRVFGDNPVVMEQFAKGKGIEETIDQAVLASAMKPVGVDRALADYLTSLPTIPHGQARLGEGPWITPQLRPLGTPLSRAESLVRTARATYPDLREMPIVQREALLRELKATGISETEFGRLQLELWPGNPPRVIPPYEPVIEQAVKVKHLMPPQAQHLLIRALKQAGWIAADIGNFLRANKASFDFSFWRQQAPLILGHSREFVTANIAAWKALWSGRAANASWKAIQNDALYPLYEELRLDFLRPLELPKGAARYLGVEEFGFLQSERLIPKFTGKLPWVKLSQRAFVTGANEHNWLIFKSFYRDMLKVNERIATGSVVLKQGEAFSISKNMKDFGKMLEDFSGRASLGKARELAPHLSGLLFAPRYALGRLLSPRHLFSANPYVRKQAWKDAVTFVGGFGSILVLGKELKLWDVNLDPRSSDFGKIRIGNTRIDPWGGYQQFVRLFAQIVTNSGVSTGTGQPYKLDPLAALTRFLRGKASPIASMVADFKTGKTYVGDDVNLTSPKQWIERVIFLAPWDIYEAFQDAGLVRAAAVALPAVLGAGVSTYGNVPRSWQGDMQAYFALPANAEEARRKKMLTHDQYRERNPEIDAKLFIVGEVTSLKTDAARNIAARLMRENGISVGDIPSLAEKPYESKERAALRRYFQGVTGQAPAPPTPAPTRPGLRPPSVGGSLAERARRRKRELEEAAAR